MLEEGATLTAMTEQGVNYANFGQQLAKVKGAYDLATASWPSDFSPDAKGKFDKAFEGWNLTYYLWGLKIGKKDNPVAPDINKYDDIVAYAGDLLVTENHPAGFIVTKYVGKKFLPFDENISVLLSLASEQFNAGRELLLPELK